MEDIKKFLILKQRQIREEITNLRNSDPVLSDGMIEVMDEGAISWQSDAHENIQAVIGGLLSMYESIQKSLHKIKDGTFGICEKCHGKINQDRLEAYPTAKFCISCT